jgi:hypothetical protein
VYFPPSSHGVYACLNSDGSGIICGGVGGFAKTCTTFGAQVVKGPKETLHKFCDLGLIG